VADTALLVNRENVPALPLCDQALLRRALKELLGEVETRAPTRSVRHGSPHDLNVLKLLVKVSETPAARIKMR
jgi:hypothetical protein